MNRFITYRPEIDGLRTVAVLSVIFYHANFNLFGQNPIKGGFLGVDIFFVISGYLITSILLTGLETKDLTLMNFYERRARRILPILLFVITTSIPLSWFFLLPSEFQQYSWQTLSSIFSVSNFYFWTEDSYWAAESILKPLLHTWSLGVEEQFYLFMPLLLLFIIKQNLRQIRYLFYTLAIVSLIASHYMSSEYAQSSFYLLPFRAWELLIGASIATLRDRKLSNLKFPFFPSLGLAVVLACFFFFDENTLHPSFYTLIPTLGVGLVILFANPKDPITNFLQNRVVVAIGLISYGLYLWHFPVFSYLTHAGVFQNFGTKIGAIGLVFLLSISTYFLIEKPFRLFSLINSKVFWSILIVWVLVLSSFAYVGTKDGFSFRFPKILHNLPSEPERFNNHTWFNSESSSFKGRIILVGDSHMRSIAPNFKNWAKKNGFDYAQSTLGGCMFILNMNRVKKRDLQKSGCNTSFQNERLKFILESPPSIVFIGGRLQIITEEKMFDNQEGDNEGGYDYFLQNDQNSLDTIEKRRQAIKENLQKTVHNIISAGHTVVLIYPVPEVGFHVPKRIMRGLKSSISNTLPEQPLSTLHSVYINRTKNSFSILDSIVNDQTHRIYPSDIFCDVNLPDRCIVNTPNASLYLDEDHLSFEGGELILRKVEEVISSRDFKY